LRSVFAETHLVCVARCSLRYFDPHPTISREAAKMAERLIFDADPYPAPESVSLKLNIRISNLGLYFLCVQARAAVQRVRQRRAQTQTISRLR
jgi:hypothetical protein